MLCTKCLTNAGLVLEASTISKKVARRPCRRCGNKGGLLLTRRQAIALLDRFIRRGSVPPECADHTSVFRLSDRRDMESVTFDKSCQNDYRLLSDLTGLVAFHYGPPLWKLGMTSHYEPLEDPHTSATTAREIVGRLSPCILSEGTTLYRVRRDVSGDPTLSAQYDTPPAHTRRAHDRFDSADVPVFYGSMDIETCVHECRTVVSDHVFLATLRTLTPLRLANLVDGFVEPPDALTDFERIDQLLAHLFRSGQREYPKCRSIARAARDAGYSGLIYPSYYSPVRHQTFRNVALFDFPVSDGVLELTGLNKVRLDRVQYSLRFGPVALD